MDVIKVGDNLGQQCKVLGIIGGPGKSGMGIVYICYNIVHKSIVAVKTFQDRFFSSVDVFNSFKLEALAWTNLDIHPHIVNAITIEDINGRPFLHLEYIAPDKLGRNTLTHYLKSPISLKRALKWGIQFCHAMEHSISHGVSPHRDIKPDNIMITNTQDLKITDFGLAKLWNQSNFLEEQLSNTHEELSVEKLTNLSFFKSTNNNIVGTPPWMAPEQFEGVANIRSDIYSFGVVLYQMGNHGKLPFIANTIEGLKEAHQKHPFPQFESKLFPIVEKCLAKSPEDRYLNFKDLRLSLEELYRIETGDDFQINVEIMNIEFDKHSYKGYSFLMLGLYDEAIQEFNKSLTFEPNDKITHSNLGNAYLSKGLFDKARDAYRRAITLSPKYEPAYVNMASVYIHKARSMKDPAIMYNAKKYLDKVLELNPNNINALWALAMYHSEFDKDENKAIKIYERCIELNTNNPKIYWHLGRKYQQLGMIDKAFVMFKKSIQINPLYEDGWFSLGYLYFSQDMYNQALPIYKKLMSINPNHPDYRENVIYIQNCLSNKNKEPNQEISSFQKKIEKKIKKAKRKKLKSKR